MYIIKGTFPKAIISFGLIPIIVFGTIMYAIINPTIFDNRFDSQVIAFVAVFVFVVLLWGSFYHYFNPKRFWEFCDNNK